MSSSGGSISIANEPMLATTSIRSQLPPRKPITLSVPRNGAIHMTKTSSGAQWAGERPKPDMLLGRGGQNSNILAQLQASVAAAKQNQAGKLNATSSNGSNSNTPTPSEFDIALLREKSKHLDLPLISALCNDRSLLKQTKVLVNPKNPKQGLITSTTPNVSGTTTNTATVTTATESTSTTYKSTSPNNNGSSSNSSISPTTGNVTTSSSSATSTSSTATTNEKLLSTSTLGKSRKTSISHRHPNDKLPPLPMQLAEANNYVMDPAILKHHKSYNSHT